MESRHSVQSTSVSYGGIGEIQKDVPNSRIVGAWALMVYIYNRCVEASSSVSPDTV